MPLTDQHRFGMQLAQMSRGWRAELDRRLAGLGLVSGTLAGAAALGAFRRSADAA